MASLRTLLQVLIGTVAALAIAEGAARYLGGAALFDFRNFVDDRNSIFRMTGNAEYDPVTGWRNKAGLEFGFYNTAEFGTKPNSADRSPLQPGGVLAIGDSFTDNGEVRNEEAWTAYLEALLGRRVVNAGVSGFGADQVVLRAGLLLDALKPSLVIWDLTDLDIDRATYYFNNGSYKPFFTVKDGRLALRNSPVPMMGGDPIADVGLARGILGYSFALTWMIERAVGSDWVYPPPYVARRAVPAAAGVAITCLLLDRMKRDLDARGIPLLLAVTYGASSGTMDARPPDLLRVLDCAAEANVAVIDLWPMLKTARAAGQAEYEKLWIMHGAPPNYGHPSAFANSLMAKEIAQAIRAMPRTLAGH